ncbi:hypothetical protein SCA04_03720 [Staphylococcus carnosus]|nr:hypothetical protein SCA04_03720 [Staphylococcus carnosus]
MIQIYMCTNVNYRANDFYSQILLFISSISILTLKLIKKEDCSAKQSSNGWTLSITHTSIIT